ncbi:amino acid permease, partial [Patescibacteria group bacterium]|nr:amino acid permease [Patescibacteria group bacterium]
MKQNKKKALSIFSLMIMNIALIASLRGLPTMADEGLAIVVFLIFAVIVFLIPVSLVSAELATGWPEEGGIYTWVKEALGERWGFAVIWTEWLQNMVFYPTALAATAGILAYGFSPTLAENKVYTLLIVISVYWGATFINTRGLKLSTIFTNIGIITGLVIPGIVLIGSGIYWVTSGQTLAIPPTFSNFIPDFGNINTLVFLTGVFLFFSGMEVSAVHAKEVRNPKKNYPLAILLSSIVIVTLFVLGSLTIAFIVPQSEISLTAGIMETYEQIFAVFQLSWLTPVLGILVAIGLVASILAWIVGPSTGVLVAAKNGNLPPFFRKTNKRNVPISILLVQGVVVTAVSLIILFMPTVSSSFWVLTALAAQLYLSVYVLMFISAIVLKYKRADVERPYSVPGGKIGMWITAGVGSLAAILAFCLGFLPPSQLATGRTLLFEGFLI